VYNTQNYWVFGLCPSSSILEGNYYYYYLTAIGLMLGGSVTKIGRNSAFIKNMSDQQMLFATLTHFDEGVSLVTLLILKKQ
jgi:hypothetical protein